MRNRHSAHQITVRPSRRKSSSNLAFAQWTSVFGDASLTATLLDRLTHHCAIHEFGWESIRFTDSLRQKSLTHKPVVRVAAAAESGSAGSTRRSMTPRTN